MVNKNRCYNGGKKHNFYPRYDYLPTNIKIKTYETYTSEQLKEILHVRKYIYDICKWCGKTVMANDTKKEEEK